MAFIVKVPGINSALVDTSGCRNAGNAIIKELEKDNLDVEEIHVNNSNLEEADELIYKNSLDCFNEKPKILFLGGDHSISYSTCRAFLDYCTKEKKEKCLVVFDAHADCMDLWEDNKTPDHEEWLSSLIKLGFDVENIILVGARKFHENEIKFLKKNKIKQIDINSIEEDIDNIADTLMEFCNGKETYVSVDVDVCDPVFAPATGYAEPGGLTSRQLIYLIQRLKKVPTLRAVDIVEINSEKDKEHNNLTVKLGAKLVGELLS
jgi:agmatinase